MKDDVRSPDRFGKEFTDRMSGGAFIWRAGNDHELLCVSERLAELYECGSTEELHELAGGSFRGLVREQEFAGVMREIEMQLAESQSRSGYVFFHILTKNGNRHRVVLHWGLVEEPEEGEVFYSCLYLHRSDLTGSDLDTVTGLYGKNRLRKYIEKKNNDCRSSEENEYAIVYLNLVRFKLLNIERGADEGDALLKGIADLLRRIYADSFIARVSDDHFAVFTKFDGVESSTEEAARIFREQFEKKFDVICKFGICRLRMGPGLEVEASLSRAKLACDFIKHDITRYVSVYTEDLAKTLQTRDYVAEKIDEALEKDWVKIYFQPVVRSLTGCLCGMESLVRWIDPYVGFLKPDEFISILENQNLIHKLDCFVVEKVCEMIHERAGQGLPVVPVSVNFSRIDFVLCDMLEVVEKSVKKYDIPRDALHIEITESMIASDEALMRDVIERFRKAGYEVWMDDFGSGYSSLNLLKDYHFDTLKLDMGFLRPFTGISRSIVRSTVNMAKDIGICTVAEGVETQEQLDFLREIGCDMIQGYYYGKPEPILDLFSHMGEKQIPIETRKWRHFYEVAGSIIRDTDIPLEVLEDDGRQLRTLFMNKWYKAQIGMEGLRLEEIDRKVYNPGSPLLPKYREIADQIRRSGKEETFYYTVGGKYFCFRGRMIAENSECALILGKIQDISRDNLKEEREKLDQKLKDLNLLFTDVLLMDLEKNTLSSLLGGCGHFRTESEWAKDLRGKTPAAIRLGIFADDRERAKAFLDYDTLRERVERSGKGYVVDVFRQRQGDGSYVWSEQYLMPIAGTDCKEYLYCIKPLPETQIDDIEAVDSLRGRTVITAALEGKALEYACVCENIVQHGPVMFFWKDTDLRLRGASRSFLDYFGVGDMSEILGKTDEEIGWLLGEPQIREREENLLRTGEFIRDAFGKVITHGIVRDMCFNEFPLYENGRIQGVVGYFVDWEEEQERILNRKNPFHVDPVTGLQNAHALIDSIIDFGEQYTELGKDYAMFVFRNSFHEQIVEDFGEAFATSLLRVVSDRLLELFGRNSVLARTRQSVFGMLVHIDNEEGVREISRQIVDAMEAINELQGNQITVRIRIHAQLRSKASIGDQDMFEAALREIS
ncbi:MAG: EAL domain-containing protein [Lachnospiraceae bacterium]|nr:EAL domain-containing protein [Lachnospiraceae bacterium]